MSTGEAIVAAVDLGAASGRVTVGRFTGCDTPNPGIELYEVHRFPNAPVRAGKTLRWNALGLFGGTMEGLRIAARRFGRIDSVGVDGWGVDYGLLDADGELLGNPVCYREPGTERAVREVLDRIGPEALYQATGCQLQPFNTLFQLLARKDDAQHRAARHALLIPDLMAYWLCGEIGTEATNASTTGMFDPRTRSWAEELCARLDVPVGLFGPLREPGGIAGGVRPEYGLPGNPRVVTVPSHDTAAAVAGVPGLGRDFAYVCTGTWNLVGVERAAPLIAEVGRLANVTNEAGVDGTTRLLRNVTGFWLIQECLRQWREDGVEADLDTLTAAAAALPAAEPIDVQDPEVAAPGDMPARVRAAVGRNGGRVPETLAEIVRCVLDGLAAGVRRALDQVTALAATTPTTLNLVGGGAANPVFCQLVADACALPVQAGPIEAAAWGNVLFQGRALGIVLDSPAGPRALIRAAAHPRTFTPDIPNR